jgi:hypothetical protein
MDLKHALKEKKESVSDDEEYIKKHKKPMQLRDIESRSSSNHKKFNEKYESEKDMNEFLEQEKKSVYFKPWNKLETGHKLNRIRKYVSSVKEERNLDDNEVKKLHTILFEACNSNKLNKVSDITYDKEKGEIKEIKILEITEDNRISLKLVQPKTKSTPKSKSNVDRFLKPGSLKSKK